MTDSTDKQIKDQLHRIKGQIEGVEKMIEKCRSCDDVIMQLMAARSSLEKVAVKLIEDETNSCVSSKNKKDQMRLKRMATTLFKYT